MCLMDNITAFVDIKKNAEKAFMCFVILMHPITRFLSKGSVQMIFFFFFEHQEMASFH